MKKTIIYPAALALAAVLAASGCSGHSSHPDASISSLAANPVVKADEQAAASLIRTCTSAAHVAQVKSCLEARVSKPRRTALSQCLAKDAAAVLGRASAKARFEAGAQSCVATALAPAPGSASIPGFPATPTASAHASAS